MDPHLTYLLVDVGCVAVPFLFSFYPGIKFYKEWKYLALPMLVVALFFLVWDALFVRLGVWSFNQSKTLGLVWFGLPLEEVLFFLAIPFASVFTWFCIQLGINFSRFQNVAVKFTLVLAVFLCITGVYYIHRAYTATTFLLLSMVLAYFFLRRPLFLASFYGAYLIILLPFFLANGMLTGTFIDQPVVIYNNHENLGIRIGTIPVEDMAYGMLLLILNIAGYISYKRTLAS